MKEMQHCLQMSFFIDARSMLTDCASSRVCAPTMYVKREVARISNTMTFGLTNLELLSLHQGIIHDG